ncbi:MAG: hypothetical protein IT285_13210, partial [Bdellovibrionales bacterium]|nr:hypothetical protein [Bdellovibrionales bacterium]
MTKSDAARGAFYATLALSLGAILGAQPASASDDLLPPAHIRAATGWDRWETERNAAQAEALAFENQTQKDAAMSLSPAERFSRMQAVLAHFQVPAEAESQPFVEDLAHLQSAEGIRPMLRLLDRDGAFARFARAEGNVLR